MTRTLSRRDRSLLVLGVLLVTAAVFGRSLAFGFVAGHDDLETLRGATDWKDHPWPLVWATWALDRALWGLDARGFHLQSLLWHLLDTGLLFALLGRLLCRWAGASREAATTGLAAAAGALFFAIHPLRAEPVAWVSSRGDAVALAFLLGALLAYLRAAARSRTAWLVVSVVLAALSLLAGPWAIALPALLLVLDAGPLGRSLRDPRVWLAKVPYAVLCALPVLLAARAGEEPGFSDSLPPHCSPLWRAGTTLYALAFYPWLTALPLDLLPAYEMAGDDRIVLTRFVLGGVIVVVAVAAGWTLRKRAPAVTAALLAYALLVLPVSGLVQGWGRAAADRCSYVACVPFAALYAWAVWRWRAMRIVAAPHLLALAALAFFQGGIWKDAETLWTSTVARDAENVRANLWLGEAEYRSYEERSRRGEREAALEALTQAREHLRNATARAPRNPRVLHLRGLSLYATGRENDVRDANRLWRQAVAVRPDDADARACAELLAASKERYPRLFDEGDGK